MSDERDDARRLILARRARFVAAALAGVSAACGKEPAPPPQPCLSEPARYDHDAEPMPCLSVQVIEPEDAGEAPSKADSGVLSTRDAAAPAPCLVPPPSTAKPRPCLSVVKPKDVKR